MQTCRPAKCIVAVRVALLDQCTLEPLCDTDNGYAIGCIIEPDWSPEIEEGEESVVKDNCGDICLRDDRCDLTKRWNLEFQIKEPDKEFLALIEGNPIIVDGEGNTIGVRQLSYGACTPYLFVELFERTDDCDEDGDPIIYRHLFPAARLRWTGNPREGVFRLIQIEGKTRDVLTDSIGTGPFGDIPAGLIAGATPDERIDYTWFEDDVVPTVQCGVIPITCNVGPGFFIDDTVVAGQDSYGQHVEVDAAGRSIVAANVTDGVDTAVTLYRFTVSGLPDPTFGGGDGKVQLARVAGRDEAAAVAIDPVDGTYLIAYTEDASGARQAKLARYTTAGVLDAGFGVGGTLDIPGAAVGNSHTIPHALHIEASGDIVVAYKDDVANGHIVRLTSAGVAQDDVEYLGSDTVRGIARISDGNYAASVSDNATGQLYASTADLGAGTHADSALIASADLQITTIPFGCASVAVDDTGRIYIAGQDGTAESHITVARFTALLAVDATWGVAGFASAEVASWDASQALDIAIDASDNVYVGGFENSAGVYEWVAAKFDSTGALVAAFDTDGIGEYSLSATPEYGAGIALNAAGTLLHIVGLTTPAAQGLPAIARVSATTGALDTTFG